MAALSKAQRKRRSRLAKTERERLMSTTSMLVDEHRITVVKDHSLKYPELWLDVFVEGSDYEARQFAEMFGRARCRKADSLDTADLVIFTGGQDVDPKLYGEERHHSVNISTFRDQQDMKLYEICLEKGIPMLGICRGAQFLSVMNGGKLYQDVDGHHGDHSMYDCEEKQMVHNVSSVHHQMVRDNTENGMEVIAYSSAKSTKRVMNKLLSESGPQKDIEAFWYPETGCVGIQGHPEYHGYPSFTKWALELCERKFLLDPRIDWIGEGKAKARRVTPATIAAREANRLAKDIAAS